MAHWLSVVLMLLPTQYFCLTKGKSWHLRIIHSLWYFSGSHLGKSTQITILHDAKYKSSMLETLKILSMRGFWMGKGIFGKTVT